jgi:DNA-binding NarL/FixJ family response regulator
VKPDKPTTILTVTEVEDIYEFFRIIKKLSPHSELILIKENTPREIILESLNIGCSYYIEFLSEFSNLPDGESKETKNGTGVKAKTPLSKRENEVLYELLMGHKNSEIAQILGITEKTVKNHLWNAYKKYDVFSRTQLFHKLLSECPCVKILEMFKPKKITKPDKVIEKLFPVT